MNRMATTISLAFRNLFRNPARTISTLLAIIVGLLGLTLLDGFITYSLHAFRDSIIRSGTGEVQIFRSRQAQDEGDSDPIPFLFDDSAAIERELRGMSEVEDVMPVLSFSAVLSDGDKTRSVQVSASPVEQALRDLTERTIVSGSDLAPGETGRILLGSGLAHLLKALPGTTLQLFALSKGGGVNTESLTVAGTTSSGIKAVDDISVSMSLADAQSLLAVDGVAKMVLFLKSADDTQGFMKRLAALPLGSTLSGLREESWDKLSVGYQYAHSMYELVLAVARLVVLVVALFSVSGTLSLAVVDRYREIGTLRAFGTRRPRLLSLLAFEGLALGIAGTAIGSIAGMAVAAGINAAGGLTMPAEPGMSVATVNILFTPGLEAFWQNCVALLAASVIAALIPGTLSFRRTIAELLRSY
jgi:putative ABC transport system permease protein